MILKQALANKMREIAERCDEADDKKIYLNAAERFRMSYWDPFVPRNRVNRGSDVNAVDEKIWGLPKILIAEAVHVKYPKKRLLRAIANPLPKASKKRWAIALSSRNSLVSTRALAALGSIAAT